MTWLGLDLESRSAAFFGRGPKNVGLDKYSKDPTTQILMLAFAFDDEPVELWDCTETVSMPARLRDGLRDPSVTKRAFNAQFERVMFRERWGIDIPYEQWKCGLALSYMLSFIGGLDEVGQCVGLPDHMKKDKRGEDLIKMFSSPQRITKTNPYLWRDSMTDPEAWEEFKQYCRQDVVAEREIWRRLSKYPVMEEEWRAYHLDQKMNDKGLPVDRQFLVNASAMAERRKAELTEEMHTLTGLANPNSAQQLTGWLVERGYPFNDIGKDTITKVLAENETPCGEVLTDEVVQALKLRQQVARTSVKKFDAVLHRLPPGEDVVRYAFQFAGASRTNRWASRGGVQLHNMPRTPGFLEDVATLEHVTELIREGDYDGVREFCEWCTKPVDVLDALVGCVRSMLCAPEGYEFVVSDLSSIETVGVGLLSGCERILNVFRKGLDAYKDFATVMYHKAYEDVTKAERTNSKPPVLAAGFGIAGGDLDDDGRKTGLWLYAEGMGIPMTREEAHAAIDAYHVAYPEVRPFSWALKDAMARTISTGQKVKLGLIEFSLMKPFLLMRLPKGRYIFYHLPQVHYEQRISRAGNPYTATVVTVMGKSEAGNRWVRRPVSPGLGVENCFSAQTKILTPCGPKPIVALTLEDEVWDGYEWVRHSGVSFSGIERTVDFGGVRVTPEHTVEVEGRWTAVVDTSYQRAVASFHGHYRAPFWPADRASFSRQRREEDTLVDAVRLWDGEADYGFGGSAGPSAQLRVYEARMDRSSDSNARHEQPSGVCGVEIDERSLPSFDASSLAQLRGARHYGVCRVAGIVRGFLARYGSDLRQRFGSRSSRQHGGIQQSQLPVGDTTDQYSKYKGQHYDSDAARADVNLRGGRGERDKRHHTDVPASPRMSGGTDVRFSGFYEPVFDIIGCGERHAFTVVGPDGGLFLAHNCDQAMCRDVLVAGLLAADNDGFDLRGSVHDEIIALRRKGDDYTPERLGECMTRPLDWLPGAPLGYGAFSAERYRK